MQLRITDPNTVEAIYADAWRSIADPNTEHAREAEYLALHGSYAAMWNLWADRRGFTEHELEEAAMAALGIPPDAWAFTAGPDGDTLALVDDVTAGVLDEEDMCMDEEDAIGEWKDWARDYAKVLPDGALTED